MFFEAPAFRRFWRSFQQAVSELHSENPLMQSATESLGPTLGATLRSVQPIKFAKDSGECGHARRATGHPNPEGQTVRRAPMQDLSETFRNLITDHSPISPKP